MFRLLAVTSLVVLALTATTCSFRTMRPEVLVMSSLQEGGRPTNSRVGNPSIGAMDCYLVIFSGGGDDFSDADTGGISHSCAHVAGRASALVSYDTIRRGTSVALPIGSYAIEILGLYKEGTSCVGQTIRQAFSTGSPRIYSLATKASTSFAAAAQVSLPSTYSAGDAVNLASSCTATISGWSFVDSGTQIGINHLSTRQALRPKLVAFDGKLYALWDELNGSSVSQIRAKVYNGDDASPAWTQVDGTGANGLNANQGQGAASVDVLATPETILAAWHEAQSGVTQIRVAAYNGNDASPAWTLVDGAGVDGLNHNFLYNAVYPSLAISNAKVYLAWQEQSTSGFQQVRVARYSGPGNWLFVDGGATGSIVNLSSSNSAYRPQLAVANGKLYAIWVEISGNPHVRVKVYNGNDLMPAWTSVGGGGLGALNFNPVAVVDAPQLAAINGKLYATWRETPAGGQPQVRVRVYNGDDSSPAWTFVDGATVNGINLSGTGAADWPQLAPFGSSLYAFWTENTGFLLSLRVARYNGNDTGPSWAFTDGGGAQGINYTPSTDALFPAHATSQSKLYLTWAETSGGVFEQIRVVVGR